MYSGIYAILNVFNNKFYVGSSFDFKRRFSEHIRRMKINKHPNIHLQRTYNKFQINPFMFVVLEYCDPSQFINREQFYIDTLKPEYNLAPVAGSTLGYKQSDETKLKMSLAQKGKKLSDNHKEKLLASTRGKPKSKEARLKMSIARRKRITLPETKLKISLSLKNNKRKRDFNKWPHKDGHKCQCSECKEIKRMNYNEWHKIWRQIRNELKC